MGIGGIGDSHVARIAGDVGVRPLVDGGQAHLEIVRHTADAGHAFRCRLGLEFLRVAADEAGQGDHAVLDRHRYIGRVDVRVPRVPRDSETRSLAHILLSTGAAAPAALMPVNFGRLLARSHLGTMVGLGTMGVHQTMYSNPATVLSGAAAAQVSHR
jgi:hypothetical protein